VIWWSKFASALLFFSIVATLAQAPATYPLRVPYWVRSVRGDPIPAVDRRGLLVEVNGRKTEPELMLGPGSALFLLIALDLTGDTSVASDSQNALASEIRKLDANTYVAVFNCQDELRVLQEPIRNPDQSAKTIQSVTATGKPGLLTSIEQIESIADAMLARSAVRVGVLFISDADVQTYRRDLTNPVINSSDSNDISRRFPEQLVQDTMAAFSSRMASAMAPLEIVQLNDLDDRWNEAYHDGLRTIASGTYGELRFCATRASIPQTVTEAVAHLVEHYSLRILVPSQDDSVTVSMFAVPEGQMRLTYRSRFSLPPNNRHIRK